MSEAHGHSQAFGYTQVQKQESVRHTGTVSPMPQNKGVTRTNLRSITFIGSLGSMGGGASEVLMLQNLQPRVHVSPMSMIVAVAVPDSPPQH